jgi:hypothetical protein
VSVRVQQPVAGEVRMEREPGQVALVVVGAGAAD